MLTPLLNVRVERSPDDARAVDEREPSTSGERPRFESRIDAELAGKKTFRLCGVTIDRREFMILVDAWRICPDEPRCSDLSVCSAPSSITFILASLLVVTLLSAHAACKRARRGVRPVERR